MMPLRERMMSSLHRHRSAVSRAPLKPERRTRTETEQMNFRVSQGLGRDIKLWALSHDVTPADVLEQGFELMKAKYGP